MFCLRIVGLCFAFFIIGLLADPASARPSQKNQHPLLDRTNCELTDNGRQICRPGTLTTANEPTRTARVRQVEDGTIIGGRPSGCPHRYCGCGLRKYLGLEDKRLNLASNWARLFPRASGPAAGLAAVRSGHVMYIERSTGDGQWLVRDYNSGGGLSRLHVRSVRGYVFVNPHAQIAQR